MSRNIVITIGRETGSGGREIAKKLSQILNIGYYDKNLIDLASEKSGMNSAVLHKADEKASNPFLSPYITSPGEYGTVNDRLFWIQSSLIKELAEKESFVIVGRCADYILSEREDCLNIFVYAPLEDRIERIKDRYMLESNEVARKEILREDKQRRSYYQYYTDQKWDSSEGKDLCINSSFFGVSKTVELIADIVRKRWPDYTQKNDEE